LMSLLLIVRVQIMVAEKVDFPDLAPLLIMEYETIQSGDNRGQTRMAIV